MVAMSQSKRAIDVGDEGQYQERKTKSQLLKDKDNEDLRNVLSTRSGRSFLWRLISECGIYKMSERADAIGKRSLGLWLIEELQKVQPDVYIQLQIEALAEANKIGNNNG